MAISIKDIHVDQQINYCFGSKYKVEIERELDGSVTGTQIDLPGELIRSIIIYSITKETNSVGRQENMIHFTYKQLPEEFGYELNMNSDFCMHIFESKFLINIR